MDSLLSTFSNDLKFIFILNSALPTIIIVLKTINLKILRPYGYISIFTYFFSFFQNLKTAYTHMYVTKHRDSGIW